MLAMPRSFCGYVSNRASYNICITNVSQYLHQDTRSCYLHVRLVKCEYKHVFFSLVDLDILYIFFYIYIIFSHQYNSIKDNAKQD